MMVLLIIECTNVSLTYADDKTIIMVSHLIEQAEGFMRDTHHIRREFFK